MNYLTKVMTPPRRGKWLRPSQRPQLGSSKAPPAKKSCDDLETLLAGLSPEELEELELELALIRLL